MTATSAVPAYGDDETYGSDVSRRVVMADVTKHQRCSWEATDILPIGLLRPSKSAAFYMLFGAALATQPPDFATVTGRDVLIESAGFSAAHELYTQRITKGKLIESILVFGEHNLDQLANDSLVISSRSLHTALDLLRRLPNRVVLPRFAPDSEGGVILSWTTFGETMLTIVEDAMLHFVFNAGSADAVYVDDVPYEDGTIPEILLEWLERAA